MNFLAHIHLSGNNEQLLIGNFITDFIRGKTYQNYPAQIQDGIQLHHKIDRFMDTHPLVKQSIERLYPHFNRYAMVIIDVFYDHFLAKNFHEYHTQSLEDFSQKTYTVLQLHYHWLPDKVQEFLPTMMKHNWLLNYKEFCGIQKALQSLSRRAKYSSNLDQALINLKDDYMFFEERFLQFFPEIMTYVQEEIQKQEE